MFILIHHERICRWKFQVEFFLHLLDLTRSSCEPAALRFRCSAVNNWATERQLSSSHHKFMYKHYIWWCQCAVARYLFFNWYLRLQLGSEKFGLFNGCINKLPRNRSPRKTFLFGDTPPPPPPPHQEGCQLSCEFTSYYSIVLRSLHGVDEQVPFPSCPPLTNYLKGPWPLLSLVLLLRIINILIGNGDN